jgi:TetR/AcrR family transcriptional regulator, transcriptional repressor for nem operon
MARPRSYERHTVVATAKQVFWEHGYEGTALGDLEDATGLSRSSIYLAFGTKRRLFDAALEEYQDSFIDARFGPVEASGAGLREAAAFFSSLATFFDDPGSQRGCLMINSIVEFAGLDPGMEALGAQFANRFRAAFLNTLSGPEARAAMGRRQPKARAEFLAASAMGVWLAVRVDHSAAATTCRAIATEIASWGAGAKARQHLTRRAVHPPECSDLKNPPADH